MTSQERLMTVLLEPIISEKATIVADANSQFVFKVLPDANKTEIKEAIELMFNVKVKNICVLNVKGKRKNFGRIRGKRSDVRKAYVSLQAG